MAQKLKFSTQSLQQSYDDEVSQADQDALKAIASLDAT
jgi:hypothetical protein